MTTTALLLLISLSAPPAQTDPPAAVASSPDERTLAGWIADLTGKDGAKQRDALAAFVKGGPKAKGAVPALTKLLGEKDAPVTYIADALGAIGPDAKSAVPALLAALPKEHGWGYSVESIARSLALIDGPKIEATRALLLSSGKCVPIYLTSSQTLHQYPAEVVAHLVSLCGDKDPKVRENAAVVISGLAEKPVQKVPTKSLYEQAGAAAVKGLPAALEKMLADESSVVRVAAARAITHTTPELTDKALAAVVTLAAKEVGTGKSEPSAWEVFRPVPEKATKLLVGLFDHENDALRQWSVGHLTAFPIREPVEDALKNGKTARIRRTAATALGARYGSARDSAPALIAALKDEDFGVRFAAALALVHVAERGSAPQVAAVPVLVEGLESKAESVRLQASQYLLMTGRAAKSAIPALKKRLSDEQPAVRIEAAITLVGIDPKEASGAVPALAEGVKAGEGTAIRAARSLAVLGAVAKDAVPALVKQYDAKNPQVRLFCAAAVARIDSAEAPKAVEVLVRLLKDEKRKSHAVRNFTLTALQQIGPAAKPAMPALAELLTDDGDFHAAAALAMLAIDPEGAQAAREWIQAALGKAPDDDGYELVDRLEDTPALAKHLVPELMGVLKLKSAPYRKQVLTLIGNLGADAKDALPELKKLAESDPRPDVRKFAAEAVKKIEK